MEQGNLDLIGQETGRIQLKTPLAGILSKADAGGVLNGDTKFVRHRESNSGLLGIPGGIAVGVPFGF